MKNQWLINSAVVALAGLGFAVQAIPITGVINFQGGTVTLNTPSITTSTAITSFGGSTAVATAPGVAPTGSFVGTEGAAVTFVPSGFIFSPILDPNPVSPLWTFTLNGLTYSFDLYTVASSLGVGPSLNLAGTGILSITGSDSAYEATAGTWTFSTTGTGPTTFGFVAGSDPPAIPDGGTTVLLLGAVLAVVGFMRKGVTA